MRCLQHALWRGAIALVLLTCGAIGALAPAQAAWPGTTRAVHDRSLAAGDSEDCVSVAAR